MSIVPIEQAPSAHCPWKKSSKDFSPCKTSVLSGCHALRHRIVRSSQHCIHGPLRFPAASQMGKIGVEQNRNVEWLVGFFWAAHCGWPAAHTLVFFEVTLATLGACFPCRSLGSYALDRFGIGLPIPQESVPAQSMCSDELLRNTRPVRCLHGGDLLPAAAVLRARRWIGPCSQPDPC